MSLISVVVTLFSGSPLRKLWHIGASRPVRTLKWLEPLLQCMVHCSVQTTFLGSNHFWKPMSDSTYLHIGTQRKRRALSSHCSYLSALLHWPQTGFVYFSVFCNHFIFFFRWVYGLASYMYFLFMTVYSVHPQLHVHVWLPYKVFWIFRSINPLVMFALTLDRSDWGQTWSCTSLSLCSSRSEM